MRCHNPLSRCDRCQHSHRNNRNMPYRPHSLRRSCWRQKRVNWNVERRHAGRGLIQIGCGPGIVGNLTGNGLIEPCDRRLACRRNRQLLGAVHNGAVGRFALRRCCEKCRRLGRVACGAGSGRGRRSGCGRRRGRETADCAGVGADAVLGASAGLGLDGRAPPPMSSSAVHGRSSITSSRLSENRSSSPSSNMRCTCPPIAGINPRPVHDALLNAILFHPFEILMTSIIWNFPSGSVLDSSFPELAPKRGGAI